MPGDTSPKTRVTEASANPTPALYNQRYKTWADDVIDQQARHSGEFGYLNGEPVARPREFDEDDVIDAAMHCFWEKGFDGATISDLEVATGISRISLYNAFGDKEGLYLAAQRRYQEMGFKMIGDLLENTDLEGLVRFFSLHRDGDPRQEAARLGCMMVNTVLDSTHVSESVLENIRAYREGLTDQFEEFLERCRDTGVIRPDLDLRACAAFVQTSMWGAMAVSRLYQDYTQNLPHISVVLDTIDSWRCRSAQTS